MAWFLELKWRGQDAYPLLREKFKDSSVYSRPDAHWAGADIVRAEVFKAFGYFVTESSQHMSEYVPYFRKRPELLERFKSLKNKKFYFWGEENRDMPVLKKLDFFEKCMISKSGHGMMIDNPVEFYSKLEEFMFA